MTVFRIVFLTTLAMIAFAGNSLLCRLALKQTAIDPVCGRAGDPTRGEMKFAMWARPVATPFSLRPASAT